MSVKDELGKDFYLKNVVKGFIVYYNERVHSTIGYSPRDFRKSKISEFIQKVKDNITKNWRIKEDKDEKYKIELKYVFRIPEL